MIVFTRAPQDTAQPPLPRTWDYAPRHIDLETGKAHHIFEHDLAESTCSFGHTCRISEEIHSIASDGTLHPSYVCPIDGCSFHEWVRFEGWDPSHFRDNKGGEP